MSDAVRPNACQVLEQLNGLLSEFLRRMNDLRDELLQAFDSAIVQFSGSPHNYFLRSFRGWVLQWVNALHEDAEFTVDDCNRYNSYVREFRQAFGLQAVAA